MYKIEVLNMSDIHKDVWNKFLNDNKEQSTVFHTQEWMLSLQDAFGYDPKYLVEYYNDSMVNVVPYMVDRRFGINNYLSMPLDTYGGVIGHGDYKYILDKFKKLSGIGVRYIVNYSNDDGVYFSLFGNNTTIVSTELKDISMSIKDIWNGLHKDNRTSIRYAEKHNIQVTDIIDYYEDIFDKVDKNLYKSIVNNMTGGDNPYCISIIATLYGEPVAASIFFIYGNMIMYWANTTFEIGRKTNANYLLLWNAIQYGKSHGCTVFNFGASPKDANSLVKFKKSWGTITHKYVKYQHVPILMKPILKIKDLIYG